MCASTVEDKTATMAETPSKEKAPHKGFLYGTISLALLITAGTVTMGHFQSRRDSLGCDALCMGSMTSARSTLTLLGSTIIGRSSDSRALDKFGGARRIFLGIGVLAIAIDITISSQSTAIQALWISMIPSALFQQNFNVMKALFGEYHDTTASAADRAGSVGQLGMAAGLAIMVGPLMSSTFLKTYDQAAIFGGLCLILATVFIWLLPQPQRTSQKDEDERKLHDTPKTSTFGRLLPDLVPAARTPSAIFIMVARLCMGLAFHIFQTIWTVALRERFNFGPQDYGRYFGFIGFTFAVSQGFLAKFLLKKFGTTNRGRARLLLICALTLGGGRMLAFQTNSLAVVYALFAGIVTALGVINTIFTTDTSKIASPQELGGLFGVLASVESLAGIAGPMLGGALAKIHPVQGPLIAVLSLYGLVFSMVYWGYERIVVGQQHVPAAKKLD
jgi:DHA1 family tetracycline resistance protein-like MFS transporter